MNKLSVLLGLFAISFGQKAIGGINQAPPNFFHKSEKAVFVDFTNAEYNITYDYAAKKVEVESTINFESRETGYPIFDLIPDPSSVTLDGSAALNEIVKDPDAASSVRVVLHKIRPGKHQLKTTHSFVTNIIFSPEGVASGFWMSDLTDRRYLEQYLPSNLEYDQYKMKIKVSIVGTDGKGHVLKTNGKVTQIDDNNYEINYPKFYTTSSVFFHLYPAKNIANNVQFYYTSIDGRKIPVDIYTPYNVQDFVSATQTILAELEGDYGPFPHNQLVIYGNALGGGMEYSGATATSLSALGHELFHSYHARALMPANGNAGWMDEAIARFRDNKYPLVPKLAFESTKLAGRSVWTRMTDRMAYTEGSAFLSWVAFRMNEIGLSFKSFLKDYFQAYKYKTVTTELFQAELTKASTLDLKRDFDKYIYGKAVTLKNKSEIPVVEENPFHPRYTEQQLLDLTRL